MKIGSIVIRCYEFDKMLAFWQEALDYVPKISAEGRLGHLSRPRGTGTERVAGPDPGAAFRKAEPAAPRPYTYDQKGEVERLVRLGATRYPWRHKPHDDFVVLEDPDGNLFCVVHVPAIEAI